jgi:hypothetical protein
MGCPKIAAEQSQASISSEEIWRVSSGECGVLGVGVVVPSCRVQKGAICVICRTTCAEKSRKLVHDFWAISSLRGSSS